MKGILVILAVGVFSFSFSARADEQGKIFSQITAQEETYIKTLHPGQAVFLEKFIVYIVKADDNLPKIVKMFCYTSDPKEIDQVARENGVKDGKIFPGDWIKLPIEPWNRRKPSPTLSPPNLKEIKKSSD